MKKTISNYIYNGKTDFSKSLRLFTVFLLSFLLLSVFISFLYLFYNETKGFFNYNIDISTEILSNILLYLLKNYLLGISILLSTIFFILSINQINYDNKTMGKHGMKLIILVSISFIYSFSHHLTSAPFVQDGVYHFVTYILSAIIILFSMIAFYMPCCTNLNELVKVIKRDSKKNKNGFVLIKTSIFIYGLAILAYLYTDIFDFHVFIAPIMFIYFIVFCRSFDSNYINNIMKLKFEAAGFDISSIEDRFQKKELGESLYLLEKQAIVERVKDYETTRRIFKEKEDMDTVFTENNIKDKHYLIYVVRKDDNFTIVDLYGNLIVST